MTTNPDDVEWVAGRMVARPAFWIRSGPIFGSLLIDVALMVMLDFQEVVGRVTQRPGPGLRLVAIDGLPLAGKSTLADRLAVAAGAERIRLDDFVKPEAEWQSHD